MVSTQLINSDCVVAMKEMADNSVDSIVTDPPYGLEFMGNKWDYDVPGKEMWKEALRVLKPGGYLLSFAGSRTYHRMAVNIEDADFEIRDQIMWIYGSGFPKSHNISKAIDKAAGAEREVIGENPNHRPISGVNYEGIYQGGNTGSPTITKPATPKAKQWDGWGTALKPAHEPIVVARKPLIGTVVENVLEHGNGGINIDGCRIKSNGEHKRPFQPTNNERSVFGKQTEFQPTNAEGRYPSNVILDEEAGEVLDEQSGHLKSGNMDSIAKGGQFNTYGVQQERHTFQIGDEGGASRFFYCAKPSQKERNAGCEHLQKKKSGKIGAGMRSSVGRPNEGTTFSEDRKSTNHHPTVKPVSLMRYLCRLVTRPEGIVLDPFMGSGTTGIAANMEGFNFIGIEMDEEYIEIARARITHSGDYEIKEDLTMERIKQPTLMDFNA